MKNVKRHLNVTMSDQNIPREIEQNFKKTSFVNNLITL